MAEAAWDYLNREDLPGLPVSAQAELLQTWSRLQTKESAAYASLIGAFNAVDGPAADGQRSLGAWLAKFTRCTPAAGKRAASWGLRQLRHPHVHQALVDGGMHDSVGQAITDWVKDFEPEDRATIEEILTQAATSGAELDDLTAIHDAALRRLRPGGLKDQEARRDAERNLTLSKTLDGVGRINGDLNAEATTLTETVVEALAVKKGPEDTRTKRQRRHDALAEAMRRLIGSDLLPERGGSKPQVKVDMDLNTLRNLPGSRQAEQEWVEHTAANLARRRFNGDTTIDLLTDEGPAPGPSAEPPSDPPSDPTFEPSAGDDIHGDSARADADIRAGDEVDTTANTKPDDGQVNLPDSEDATRCGSAPGNSQTTRPDALGADSDRALNGRPTTTSQASELHDEPTGTSHADEPVPPDGPAQPRLPGLDEGADLEGVGAISKSLAAGLACDSVLTPTVTGTIDYDALNGMTDQWLSHHLPQYTGCTDCAARAAQTAGTARHNSGPHEPDVLDPSASPDATGPPGSQTPHGPATPPGRATGDHTHRTTDHERSHDHDGHRRPPYAHDRYSDSHSDCGCEGARRWLDAEGYARLQAQMLRWAIQALSGPGGLASYLRTRVLERPLAGPSIVLDAGKDDRTVPAALERLARRRDKGCRFPGCDHLAPLSQVHHIVPRSKGGPTELWNLLTLCSFHHLIAVHSWGWEIQLNPDGTTTATAPDGRKLHEHNPPGTPPLWAA